MEETLSSPAEINRKRKLQTELLESPRAKHVRWEQRFEHDSSSDSSLKKVDCNIFAKRSESDSESAKDSNSFHCDDDSAMSESAEPCTSSSSWISTYSEMDLYSLTTSSSCKSESKSINEEHNCLYNDYGLIPSLNYEEEFLESRILSEYGIDSMECRRDKELDNLISSNEVAPSNFVLSSGRWSVNQDSQEDANKKLTIDKEFEQYFSMLMLW
ncbi:hypothetical protein ACJIZ3_024100 [Penstemon smallii]|uniref:Uncharacterized protein n=1 Tax=Penstemon smallii TaxID=265156 RepID=A0ABD3TQW1_9LAMI